MSTNDCKGCLLTTTTRLEPIESHLTLKNPETRNSIYQTIKSHTGLNTDKYRVYITVDYDMVIFLTEGLAMPRDIKRLRLSIMDISNLIANVDIFTADGFDANVFSINQGHEFIEDRGSFEPISFTIPAELVVPDGNEAGKFTIDLLNEMGHDLDFDKAILPFMGIDTWHNSSIVSNISKTERAQSVSETVALFTKHIGRYNESSGFTEALENLSNYFKKETVLKHTSGISELIFNASSVPFSSNYAKMPFYTHIHNKLYLLLYITFKQYILKELLKSESVKAMKSRGSSRFLGYLEKVEIGEEVNSDLLNNFLETNTHINTSILREALNTTIGEPSRVIAKVIKVLFSTPDNTHKPINKYLELMGLGQLTHIP